MIRVLEISAEEIASLKASELKGLLKRYRPHVHSAYSQHRISKEVYGIFVGAEDCLRRSKAGLDDPRNTISDLESEIKRIKIYIKPIIEDIKTT